MIRRRIAAVALATVLGAAGTMTSVSGEAQAAWPGSNGTIYFVCRAPGVGFSGQDICRVNPDGSGLANLTNTPTQTENVPDVSRDGSKVAFTRTIGSDTRVWVMNPDGTGQVQVTTVPSDGASFTPSGDIAFRAKVNATDYEFWVVPLTGSAHTVLRAANGSDSPPRYMAGGSWLYSKFVPVLPGASTETTQVFVVTGGTEQQVTASDPTQTSNNFPSWSPGGDKVIYQRTSSSQTDLYTVPSAGGTEVRLTNTPSPVQEAWAQFSPDSSKLVFHQQDATHDFFHVRLMVSAFDGSSPVPLATPGYDYAGFAVWAPTAGSTPAQVASFTADAPKTVKASKKAKVTLRCLGDVPCVVTYGAVVKVPGPGRTEKFTVKDTKVTLAGHTVKKVKLTLPGKAVGPVAAALKAGRKPTYKVTVAARQTAGALIRKLGLKISITS